MAQRAELKSKIKADFIFLFLRGESSLVVKFIEECNTLDGVMTVVLYISC